MSFSVIIPSGNLDNVVASTRAVLQHEPTLRREQILVVNDGRIPGEAFQGVSWSVTLGANRKNMAHGTLQGMHHVFGVSPFVFARNVNLGIAVSRSRGVQDVILLNDDALLLTPNGFQNMQFACEQDPGIGIVGAACETVGQVNQFYQGTKGVRHEPRMVCFVCVYIPKRTLDAVGDLDERYTGYGFDDDDYCQRILNAGLKIVVADTCRVSHDQLPSSYRSQGDNRARFEKNRAIYIEKWGSHDGPYQVSG